MPQSSVNTDTSAQSVRVTRIANNRESLQLSREKVQLNQQSLLLDTKQDGLNRQKEQIKISEAAIRELKRELTDNLQQVSARQSKLKATASLSSAAREIEQLQIASKASSAPLENPEITKSTVKNLLEARANQAGVNNSAKGNNLDILV